MNSDDRRFQIFLARTQAAHRAKCPNKEIDLEQVTHLARAMWETLTQEQRESVDVEPLAYTTQTTQTPARKATQVKDPNAPKRPRSAFLFFSMDEVRLMRRQHPELSMKQVMTSVSEKWQHQMKDKSHYETLAAKDKQRYYDEMTTYNPPTTKVDLNQSKSAFHIYSMEETKILCNAMPHLSLVEAMELVKQHWELKQQSGDRATDDK